MISCAGDGQAMIEMQAGGVIVVRVITAALCYREGSVDEDAN